MEEKASGKDSPDILIHLNHLALLLGKGARYGEVEPLLRRALRIIDSNAGLIEREPVKALRVLDRRLHDVVLDGVEPRDPPPLEAPRREIPPPAL